MAGPRITRDQFYANIPVSAMVILYAGVFCLFAPVIPLSMSSLAQNRPWYVMVFWTAISGASGMLWAIGFTRYRRVIPLAVASQFAISIALALGWPRALAMRPATLSVETLAVIVFMVAGYALMIVFIARQGLRTIKMLAELTVAQRMHASLVPPITLRTPMAEAVGRSIASSEMGGDLIDIVHTPDRVDILLGDVSGHGVGAGVVMAMLKASIRTRLLRQAELSEVLADANTILAELTAPEMFATFAAVRLLPEGRMQFALAGHLPVIHFQKASGAWVHHPNQSMPLGIDESERFVHGEARVGPGDLLVLYTDGLTEVQNAAGAEMTPEGLASVIEEETRDAKEAGSLDAMLERIVARVRAHGPQLDDQSLLIVRVGSAVTAASSPAQ